MTHKYTCDTCKEELAELQAGTFPNANAYFHIIGGAPDQGEIKSYHIPCIGEARIKELMGNVDLHSGDDLTVQKSGMIYRYQASWEDIKKRMAREELDRK